MNVYYNFKITQIIPEGSAIKLLLGSPQTLKARSLDDGKTVKLLSGASKSSNK